MIWKKQKTRRSKLIVETAKYTFELHRDIDDALPVHKAWVDFLDWHDHSTLPFFEYISVDYYVRVPRAEINDFNIRVER